MKKLSVLVIVGMLGAASVAHAHFAIKGVADTKSPLATLTPINFSDTTYIYNRLAILNGEEAAAEVLNGGPQTDQFLAAVTGAQTLTDVKFKTPEEAALAVLDLAEQLRDK